MASPAPDFLPKNEIVIKRASEAPKPVSSVQISVRTISASSVLRSMQYASIGNGLFCRVGRRRK